MCASKLAVKSQNCSLDFQVFAPKLSKVRDGINFFHTGHSLSVVFFLKTIWPLKKNTTGAWEESGRALFIPPTDKNQDPLELSPRLLDEVRGTAFPGTRNYLNDGPTTQQWGMQVYRFPITHMSLLS